MEPRELFLSLYKLIACAFLMLPYALYGMQIVQQMGKKEYWIAGAFAGAFIARLVIISLECL